MFHRLAFALISVAVVCFGSSQGWAQSAQPEQNNDLLTALQSKHPAIKRVMDSSANYELQIRFARPKPESAGYEVFSFQANPKQYFYPASTVKLPMALLAAEVINQHRSLTIHTPYRIAGDTRWHTIARDIELIFTISDDDAYNRLYELVGRDHANQRLHELGYLNTRIAHRLGVVDAAVAKRRAIEFQVNNESSVQIIAGDDSSLLALQVDGLRKGEGVIKDSVLQNEPFDFTFKNRFALTDQQILLQDFMTDNDGFELSSEARRFLKVSMAKLPRQAGFDEADYFDGFGKFFLYGDTKSRMPDHIEIFNKVGYAYGTLSDNAYLIDSKNDISFYLAATILVNKNGVFNDDQYEYDDIGLPFLAQLGRELYQQELVRAGVAK